ncbi:sec-independent protein translocase protein TatB [Sphingomonas vulcanisoli]|uniref:Sec-independent protein translocase protein TatB n=1 Tax=Sphingomonas vulcanisoli TaxID=1658060 RepID=A0ABX0TQ65_9SPHN|nr:Sec-independent protein translocase protein TatB [Sphingomonas vulcanisoli]NIJ07637.1 sec-independent protein translocase protein TatB [Sphingomonas vulcanisoli]
MFGIEPSEYLLVAIVALVVIGPKDLPRVMRIVGQWVGRARGMARHFRAGFDEMVRQSEMEEMEKRWKEENERIMREHPPVAAPAEEANDAHYAMLATSAEPEMKPALPAPEADPQLPLPEPEKPQS